MGRDILIKRHWRELKPLFAAGVALAAIVAWMLFGQTGLFAWSDYSHALATKRAELAELKQEQASLENRQRLLNPRHVDPDLAEELVREQENFVHPDDIIVPLK